jgi:hypothetical protein
VGNSFLLEAQINVELVIKVKKYNHQSSILNISPGIIIMALQIQLTASTIL